MDIRFADIACRELGYPWAQSIYESDEPNHTFEYFIKSIDCRMNENATFVLCDLLGWLNSERLCPTAAGVVCLEGQYITLIQNEGFVLLYMYLPSKLCVKLNSVVSIWWTLPFPKC